MSDDFTLSIEVQLTVEDAPALLEAFGKTDVGCALVEHSAELLAESSDLHLAVALQHLVRPPTVEGVPGVTRRGTCTRVTRTPQDPPPKAPERSGAEHWRRGLTHDGYVVATLRLATPEEGGWDRVVQSGYFAQWWLVVGHSEHWLGPAGLDLLGERRSLKPGETGQVAIYPQWPAYWRQVEGMRVLRLREGLGKKTLGVATVSDRVNVPLD
jgi:hypothetical protein